jgi:hypothetical protein
LEPRGFLEKIRTMRFCSVPPSVFCLFFVLALSASSADATSVGKAGAISPTACSVTAKFVTAKSAAGKIVWIFDPTSSEALPAHCEKLAATFEIFIPSGSYSKLSGSNVYPLSIAEPKSGDEIDLHLESVRMKSGETRWLLAGDSDAFRVRH